MLVRFLAILIAIAIPASSHAELLFQTGESDDGLSFIIVTGKFEFDDDLRSFERLVRFRKTEVVGFDSAGGNIFKAMELGRMIRKFGLDTVQPRKLDCASACALAFMGGELRFAEPGSIGVHKTSFDSSSPLTRQEAVSAVQEGTAAIIRYMSEMGVSAELLQLALSTDANDLRYLSGQEMAEYSVTRSAANTNVASTAFARPSTSIAPPTTPSRPRVQPSQVNIPIARTGLVRHPKGMVLMKAAPNAKATNIARVANGAAVSIVGNVDRWYRVRSAGRTGYMHHTWVRVDQFDATSGFKRLIQVKSFDNSDDAVTYAKALGNQASVYLATNGWYAITFGGPLERKEAIQFAKGLKRKGYIPKDSFVTLGNTYMVQICCSGGPGTSLSAQRYWVQKRLVTNDH